MPSPQRLMDSLGPPPPDVCLDWAWQLHELVDGNLHYKLDWWQLAVSESGELFLHAPDTADFHAGAAYPAALASEPRVLDLIDELLSWSSSHSSNALVACESSPTTAEDLLHRLEQRTREVLQQSGSSRLTMPLRMEGGHASSPQQLASFCQPEQQVFPRQPAQSEEPVLTKHGGPAGHAEIEQPSRQKLPGRRTKARNGRNSIKRRPATAPVSRGVWLGGVAAMGLALALTMGSLFWPVEDAERLASTPNVIPQAARDVPHGFEPDDGNNPETNQPIAVAELSTLAESWDPSALETRGESEPSDQPLLEMGLPALDTFVEPVGTQRVLSQTGQGSTASSTEPLQQADAGAASMRDSLPDTSTRGIDVLGELERVSRAAEAQSQEREVAESDSHLGNEKPLMIGTSTILQHYRLPTAVDARIRQPEWSIRLAGVEGCRVQPDGNQRVSSRDAVGWLIEEEAMQPPTTRVVVLASLLNNRSAGLRWRIAAVAEDLPQIAFPLGAADLDSMHAQLRRLRQDLKTQTERLRMLGSTSGLSSHVRTTVTAQRKEFEAQEKLAERIQQILADAHRLQALLDGHIEVHAQVFDSSKKGSTAVLQFGTPDDVEAQDPADVVPTR